MSVASDSCSLKVTKAFTAKATILEVDFPIRAETLCPRRLLRVDALIVQRQVSVSVNSRRFGVCWIAQA
jgi:hypothetical protein